MHQERAQCELAQSAKEGLLARSELDLEPGGRRGVWMDIRENKSVRTGGGVGEVAGELCLGENDAA